MASPEPATPFDILDAVNDQFADDLNEAVTGERPQPRATADETIVGRIRRFIQVQARLSALAAEEKALKKEERELSDQVIEMMIEQGMDSPPGVDGMTAYLTPVYFTAKKIDPETGEPYTAEEIYDALRESGLTSMIKETYNGNSMKALLREYAEHETEVPAPLDRVLGLDKRRELRITPMGEKKRTAAPRT